MSNQATNATELAAALATIAEALTKIRRELADANAERAALREVVGWLYESINDK